MVGPLPFPSLRGRLQLRGIILPAQKVPDLLDFLAFKRK